MRILNVLFDDRYGGPPKRVLQVAEKLSERGVRTALCLPTGSGNAAGVAREAGMPVSRIDFERVPRPSDPGRVARWLVRLPGDVRRFLGLYQRERPDVVHVNGAFFLAPAIAAKLARVPLVWHLNDTVVPAPIAPVFGVLVRALADRVVVAAEAVARHYGVADHPHAVIYAPVDVSGFRPGERSAGGGKSRVGMIANWNPLKGLEYFVRAAALVREERDVEAVIAGARLETYADYARGVDGLIGELGIRPAVRDLGFVPSAAAVLETLDVLVLSSISEASPMVVLEGMAAGVPVVATDVGGVREMLLGDPDNPAGIVVETRSPEAIAAAVLELLRDPDKAARMGRSGRKLAEERFSLEICARRHLEVYKAAVSRSKRGANGRSISRSGS